MGELFVIKDGRKGKTTVVSVSLHISYALRIYELVELVDTVCGMNESVRDGF